MASSSLEVNNTAKTEDLSFTVGKLTKVNPVFPLEVDLCKFISRGALVLLSHLCFYLRILDEHWFPWGWKKRFKKFSSKGKTKQSSSRGKYLYRG